MLSRLVVHAGANKTGSSAIQTFLAHNHGALREEGIVVPDTTCGLTKKVAGHQVFYLQELLSGPDGPERLERDVDAIARAGETAHTLLLSGENLAANPAAPKLFEALAGKYDTRLILYIRRQDDYLLSSWQQWYSKISDDFWAWLIDSLGKTGNWAAYLRAWGQVLPDERITVRVFEPEKLTGGDVVRDFLGCLGVERAHDEFVHPKTRVNPSFAQAVQDLVAGNRFIFDDVHDNRFYSFVQELTDDTFFKQSGESPITHEQRQAIIDHYGPGNAWVRRTYLPDWNGPLFAPLKPGDYTHVPPEARDRQQREFLVSMLYALRKKGKI